MLEPESYNIAVIGSRDFQDFAKVSEILDNLAKELDIASIVSGGARGADYLGKRYAIEHSISYVEFPADWNKYGKKAGYVRNHDIVNYADIVIAFWDGYSQGTKHSINLSKRLGKVLTIVHYPHSSL